MQVDETIATMINSWLYYWKLWQEMVDFLLDVWEQEGMEGWETEQAYDTANVRCFKIVQLTTLALQVRFYVPSKMLLNKKRDVNMS